MKQLFVILIVTISNSISLHCQNSDLLLLNELYSLDNHSIRYGVNGEILEVWNDKTNQQIKDYDKVEKLIISTCLGCDDTLWVSNEDFPNLKSLVLNGVFFNELVQVSKLKTLQHLDITKMSQGDFNMSSYKLFFPPEFWELKRLQSLEVSAEAMSDISENIVEFKHLKHLGINGHERPYQLVIPWSLLLLENFQVLAYNNFEIDNQEDLFLFHVCSPFLVVENYLEYFKIKRLNEGFCKSSIFINKKNQAIELKNDSLKLTIPLNEIGKPDGLATLVKGDEVLQSRNFKNGEAHGKWYLKLGDIIQKRNYRNGIPYRKWVFRKKAPYIGYKRNKIHFKKGGEEIIIRFRPPSSIQYSNYNDVDYFERTYD